MAAGEIREERAGPGMELELEPGQALGEVFEKEQAWWNDACQALEREDEDEDEEEEDKEGMTPRETARRGREQVAGIWLACWQGIPKSKAVLSGI